MFIGNKKALRLVTLLAQKQDMPPILFSGPSGFGKNTLAKRTADLASRKLMYINASTIETHNNLFGCLQSTEDGYILFLDEVHSLPKKLQEALYPVMDTNSFSRLSGRGSQQRISEHRIPRITIFGATTREDKLLPEFKNRFVMIQLQEYSEEEMVKMARVYSASDDERVHRILAEYSRGNPRRVQRLAHLMRGLSLRDLLSSMDLFPLGITRTELNLMRALKGRTQSLKSLASQMSLKQEVIEDEHEPYLMRLGFIDRTQQGRSLTIKGQKYLYQNQRCSHETSPDGGM